MTVIRTISGTYYELRRVAPEVLEGRRYSKVRTLHLPVNEWTPVVLQAPPRVGYSMGIQFEGMELINTTLVESIALKADHATEAESGDGN